MTAPDLESLATLIRTARENKGLSQRALGARVGIPQSHISKIESGSVDLQTSNLMQLARALDLELALVPRSVLPAVESLSAARSPKEPPKATHIRRQLSSLRTSALKMRQRYPKSQALQQLIQTLTGSDWLRSISDKEYAHTILQSIDALQDSLRKLRNTPRTHRPSVQSLLLDIENAERALRETRNALVHGQRPPPSVTPTPAYQLDEEESSEETDHG